MGCGSSSAAPPTESKTAAKNASDAHKTRILSAGNFHTLYKMTDTLGKGQFGVVRLCVSKANNQRFAVKIVRKDSLRNQEEIDALYVEVEVMMKLDHPNIVKCYHFYEDQENFYLVMELMTGGQLLDELVRRTRYTESEARSLVRLLTRAVNYCHEQGVVHRDLKPDNILLADNTPDAVIKIADFGFAKTFVPEEAALRTACGTPHFVAPEILRRRPYDNKVDIWSLGVIFYILLCGYPPFYADNQDQMFHDIMAGRYEFDPEGWSSISDGAKDLVRKILVVDPAKRITAQQILSHPWVTSDEVSDTPLAGTIDKLKAYNARRRMKRAINAVRATNLMAALATASTEVDQQQPATGTQ